VRRNVFFLRAFVFLLTCLALRPHSTPERCRLKCCVLLSAELLGILLVAEHRLQNLGLIFPFWRIY
jgi:hypothetical protein